MRVEQEDVPAQDSPHLRKRRGVVDEVHERRIEAHGVQVLHPVGDAGIGRWGFEPTVTMEAVDHIDERRCVIPA